MSARRASFSFPAEAVAALAAIKRHTYYTDDSDVIRLALSVFDSLLTLAELNCRITIRDQAKEEWPYSPYTRFHYRGLDNRFQATSEAETAVAEKNFFFSGPAVDRLHSIRARSEVKTNADAVRLAMEKFWQLLQIDLLGDAIIVRDLAGNESLFNLFNPHARRELCQKAKPVLATNAPQHG